MQKMEGATLNRRMFMDDSCLRKVRHATLASAEQKAARLGDKHGETNIHPYQCRFCGGWHVGHSE